MNQDFTSTLQDRLALHTMMQTHKPGDHLVLADPVLNAALDGSRPLRQSEWQALLGSALTLRRMQVLEAQRQARAGLAGGAATTLRPAANDAAWRPSHTLLRAAAGADLSRFTQGSDDGRWMLYALKTGADTRLVLKLQPEAEHADLWLAARPEVAVLDGEGNTLLLGALDEDGELQGPWVHEADLRTHLAAHGHGWRVERV